MKLMYVILCGVLVGATSAHANVDGDRPALVKAPILQAYIPTGFDSNDRAQIVIEGAFSSTCYRTGPQDVEVDQAAKKITVTEGAYYYQGMCLMMLVEFNQTVNLGILTPGDYTVIDGATKKSLGTLPIAKATNSGPDDYLYAAVRDAYVNKSENGEWVVTLKLQMPGSCWVLDETRVLQEGKEVVTVLPILARRNGERCDETSFPYATTVKLPKLEKGRHLLHVRSLEGQAITKLIDLD